MDTLSMNDFIRAKEALVKANVPTAYLCLTEIQDTTVESFDYDDYDYDDACECDCEDCTEQEKENTMSYDTLKFRETAEGKRVQYLEERASALFYEKDSDLQKQFGLRDDDYPQEAEELVKRIQDGKFTITEKTPNNIFFGSGAFGRLRFRDPAMKRDEAGYNAAYQKLQALLQDTKDAIMIKSADEGLAAVKAFEAATIQ